MTHSPPTPYADSITFDDSPDIRPPLNDHWRARRELAEALRQLNTAILTADAPTGQLREVAAVVRAQTRLIEDNRRIFGREAMARHHTVAEQAPDLRYEMTPANGFCNAVAPAMHIWIEDGRPHGRVTPDWSYEGPSGHLHGGIIAMLFDHFLGVSQRMTGNVGHTALLNIRYHHLTPINKPLRLVAEVSRIDGRRKILNGELWADDVRTASCEGVFVTRKTPLQPLILEADGTA